MRSIKFRVWNEKSAKYESGVYINENGSIFADNTYDLIQLEGDNWITQQFTGLTDSTGREIYEGDICKYIPPMYSLYGPQDDCVVYFNQTYYGMFISSLKGKFNWTITPDLCNKNLEVIGNINENL